MIELIIIIIAILFAFYAMCEFISRVRNKKPFWPSFKKFVVNLWDTISGIG